MQRDCERCRVLLNRTYETVISLNGIRPGLGGTCSIWAKSANLKLYGVVVKPTFLKEMRGEMQEMLWKTIFLDRTAICRVLLDRKLQAPLQPGNAMPDKQVVEKQAKK